MVVQRGWCAGSMERAASLLAYEGSSRTNVWVVVRERVRLVHATGDPVTPSDRSTRHPVSTRDASAPLPPPRSAPRHAPPKPRSLSLACQSSATPANALAAPPPSPLAPRGAADSGWRDSPAAPVGAGTECVCVYVCVYMCAGVRVRVHVWVWAGGWVGGRLSANATWPA